MRGRLRVTNNSIDQQRREREDNTPYNEQTIAEATRVRWRLATFILSIRNCTRGCLGNRSVGVIGIDEELDSISCLSSIQSRVKDGSRRASWSSWETDPFTPINNKLPVPQKIDRNDDAATKKYTLYDGRKLYVKSQTQTRKKLLNGDATIFTCPECQTRLHVAKSARLIYCPQCCQVSPMEGNSVDPSGADKENFYRHIHAEDEHSYSGRVGAFHVASNNEPISLKTSI